MDSNIDQIRAGIVNLSNKYESLRKELDEKGLQELSEANVRKDFVDPLFEILGWSVRDSHEYDAESYVRGAGYVDITLKLAGKPSVFIEAKRFGLVPSRGDRVVQTTLSGYKIFADWTAEERQVLNYAGMSVGVKWAILSNFEKFRLFNAKTGSTILDIEKPEEYLEHLEELILLSKHNVSIGNIEKLESRIPLPDIDPDFLNLLDDWRLRLSRNILLRFPQLELDKIKQIVQRILDRLIIIRYAEDKWILEDTDQLRATYETWLKTKTYQKLKLTGLLKGIFEGFNDIHDSKIFQPDTEIDSVLDGIDSEVLGGIIVQLYNQSFRKFTSDILGNTYENYLGHELLVKDGTLVIEPNKRLRKSGGIYYTRSYVVDYAVKKTLGLKLETIWKQTETLMLKGKRKEAISMFSEIKGLKIVDPACGSGSFLIRAFHVIKGYYERYNDLARKINDEIVEEILKLRRDGNNQVAWQLEGTKLDMFENFEKDILFDNIFGVDLDPQAAEIASVNLVLQALKKGEKLPLLLQQNIKSGNSIISDEDGELKSFFEEPQKERIFNWSEEFRDIMSRGGFDIVIGNPPHGGALTKEERDFYGEMFEIAQGYRNTASLFIERGAKILRQDGFLSFVIPKSLTYSEKWNTARSFILDKMHLLEIADISKAFPKVLLEQVVIIASKGNARSKSYVGTKLFYDEPLESSGIPFELAENLDAFPINITSPMLEVFEKTQKVSVQLGSISRTFRGLPIQSKVEEKATAASVPLIRGDDIKPYYLEKSRTFVKKKEIDEDNEKLKLMRKPKIVSQRIVAHVLKPTDHIIIMSTFDKRGILNVDTVENTILTNGGVDPRYVVAWINSTFVAWYAYLFIFNKAVRTMDFDDYYVGKIPIVIPKKREIQSELASHVEELLELTKEYFSQKPSFEGYLNKVEHSFSKPFQQIYDETPMSQKQFAVPFETEGTIRSLYAETIDDDLIINSRYLDEDGEENDSELLRLKVQDPMYLAFLKESINITTLPKSKGRLIERVFDIWIPTLESNKIENLRLVRKFMKEYMKDVTALVQVENKIETLFSKIDTEIYKLLALKDSEIEIIKKQVGENYYVRKSMIKSAPLLSG